MDKNRVNSRRGEAKKRRGKEKKKLEKGGRVLDCALCPELIAM